MSDHKTDIVVAGLIERDGKIFAARRAATKKVFPGRIEFVGGHVDPGETLEEALKREIKEEVGLDVVVGQIVGAFTYESEARFKVEICFICRPIEGQNPEVNPEDHSEGIWIDESNIEMFDKEDDETRILRQELERLKEQE